MTVAGTPLPAASSAGMPTTPRVSVLIPCLNSGDTLRRCLDSVRGQLYPNVEVIVCDGGSVDESLGIATELGARVVVGGPERSRQCNSAAAAATGDYLYRIDADFIVDRDVIMRSVEACERRGFDCVAVHNRGSGSSFWQRARTLERDCYRGDQTVVAVRFMRRTAFEAVGGFDPDLIAGEDYDLHNRLTVAGYRWTHIDAVETHLGEPRTIGEAMRKSFYYGRSFGRYLRRHPARGIRQVNPVRGAYLRNWRMLARRPILTGGLLVLKLAQYAAAAVGLLLPIRDSQTSAHTRRGQPR